MSHSLAVSWDVNALPTTSRANCGPRWSKHIHRSISRESIATLPGDVVAADTLGTAPIAEMQMLVARLVAKPGALAAGTRVEVDKPEGALCRLA
jgi:hypothetical protein